LIGISQRNLYHIDYSSELIHKLGTIIETFFESKLKDTFPDPDFVFDVYIPEPHDRVRLIDINPWAPRTDPLLFSWLELLTLKLPQPLMGVPDRHTPLQPFESESEATEDDDVEELPFRPEFRYVKRDDPEAFSMGAVPYSAHKMPKDVVDASVEGPAAIKELMDRWQELMSRGNVQGVGESSSDEE
jgi:hypothetical protein